MERYAEPVDQISCRISFRNGEATTRGQLALICSAESLANPSVSMLSGMDAYLECNNTNLGIEMSYRSFATERSEYQAGFSEILPKPGTLFS